MSEADARRAIERAARVSYGRLLALVAARTHDIAAAEDALADALQAALTSWPRGGVPDRPEAWLLVTARRRIGQARRHASVRQHAQATLDLIAEEQAEAQSTSGFPDERLKLLLICAHPAIDESLRTPLMLNTVLGLDAARIASAYLTAPATMSQRLVRAKAKIKLARLPFEAPSPSDLGPRLATALEAIYAAYGVGWDDPAGADPKRKSLAAEAIFLGRLIVALAPEQAEARGLLALMLYCQARAPARRSIDGMFIPLSRQDRRLWSGDMIRDAEAQLGEAARLGAPGRFQLEAAIQSAHVARLAGGPENWTAITHLHDLLEGFAPTIGVRINRAAAHAEAFGAEIGLRLLDQLAAADVRDHQPFWATRAHLLARQDHVTAAAAYDRAIGLAEDQAVRAYLLARKSALGVD